MPEGTFDFFENYIRAYDLFSDEDITAIRSLAISKQLKKRQYLLRQGSICRYYTFVCCGCLRLYRIDDDGNEHILDLSPAGHWISDRASLLTGMPSNEFIDALENTTVIQFSTCSFKWLLEEIPNFNKLNTKLITDDCDISRDRIYMMLSRQAEDRYREFVQRFPQLHERIPLYMIASYIGVSRETLTRIRSNISLPNELQLADR